MVRRTLGQYVVVCPRLQLTSYTQETSTLSRIKCERYIFIKKCVRSFIDVRYYVDYVSACICICIVVTIQQILNSNHPYSTRKLTLCHILLLMDGLDRYIQGFGSKFPESFCDKYLKKVVEYNCRDVLAIINTNVLTGVHHYIKKSFSFSISDKQINWMG